ncbi:magnesium transporter CorA family protein [Pseudonocardia sp.]|uniref:magnesium transporter CorA family protein n=1 Tax=Pseudonocardia sp. TaxID=60912 RepID=UPI003D0961CC
MRARVVSDGSVTDLTPSELPAVADSGLLWIDLDHEDRPGMALLPGLLAVRSGDLEDCHLRTPVPKMHLYPDHHYTAINGLARGTDGRLYLQPLKVFQNPRVVVTVLGPTSSALDGPAARRELDAVHRRLDRGFRPTASLELITAIRREMLATLELLVVSAAERISDIEHRVATAHPVRSERMLDELFAVRHDLQTIRTSAAQAQQTYTNLLESTSSNGPEGLLAVDERRVRELRQGFAHLVQTTDLEREFLQEMLELFQTRVATELNRFVRRVTAWGTIGIAWTVVVGVYGMNVVGLPLAESRWGLALIAGSMLASGVALAALFHRHGWL